MTGYRRWTRQRRGDDRGLRQTDFRRLTSIAVLDHSLGLSERDLGETTQRLWAGRFVRLLFDPGIKRG